MGRIDKTTKKGALRKFGVGYWAIYLQGRTPLHVAAIKGQVRSSAERRVSEA